MYVSGIKTDPMSDNHLPFDHVGIEPRSCSLDQGCFLEAVAVVLHLACCRRVDDELGH